MNECREKNGMHKQNIPHKNIITKRQKEMKRKSTYGEEANNPHRNTERHSSLKIL